MHTQALQQFLGYSLEQLLGIPEKKELDFELNKRFLTLYLAKKISTLDSDTMEELLRSYLAHRELKLFLSQLQKKVGKDSVSFLYSWYEFRRQFIIEHLKEQGDRLHALGERIPPDTPESLRYKKIIERNEKQLELTTIHQWKELAELSIKELAV